ncbi:MAG TPA: TatD family hydrolase [Candidatus Udaeobacter sp.]|jgi:predicted TIM-barrel fold metal-dependent hydrolase|nr:TatD family hydrolase [Candidatus Udaeobacter sp.]
MVIDCHTHLDDDGDADKLLQSMDEAGIDASIVIAETLPGDVSNVVQVLDAVSRSDRLWALVNCVFSKTVELKYVEELTRLLQEERVVGLKFYLGYEEYSANDERLHQLYEYCEQHDVPIMFHTGVLEAGSTGLLEYSHPLQVDRVATCFPNLNIVMAHMGNPWLIDCAAVLAKNQNVFADMSAFFAENMPITAHDVKVFKQRMEQVRVFLYSYQKFLFGTDYPLYSQREYLGAVQALEMEPAERELVMHANAARIFGITTS